MGIADEARYCPYCGERIYTWGGDNSSKCQVCSKEFYVFEKEEEDENSDRSM